MKPIRRMVFIVVALLSATLSAQTTVSHPWKGVTYTFEKRAEPAEEIHVVTVELKRVKIRTVAAGADPDGPGKWQTTLMPTSEIAQREGFDIAVNGDFFAIPRGKDAEGEAAQKLFENGIPALATGPAMTDGKAWSASEKARQCLVVDRKRKVRLQDASAAPADATQVICGRDFLVREGKAQFSDENVAYKPGEFRNINPRTAVGIDKKGKKLILLVVDGRSELSRGMTYGQLAAEMMQAGAYTAINLDGGGSSTLVLRQADGTLKVMNKPSDRKERAVANALGVVVKK